MHSRNRVTIEPRIPAMTERSMSGFHRTGRHCLHLFGAKGREVFDKLQVGGCGERGSWLVRAKALVTCRHPMSSTW